MAEPNQLGMLSEEALAEQLSVTKRTLAFWRQTGIGPPASYAGRKVFYDLADAAKWLKEAGRKKRGEAAG
jgi:DNA-binding transcriptional MerR regulator